MAASIKNILIGIFVFIALSIIIFMLLFLHPSVGDNAKTLRVRFTDIDKVNIGTRVTFAGRPVGEVVSIQELPSARTNRLSDHGEVYVYELILKVDSSVDVFNTDVVILRTSGLLGERNIEIDPKPLRAGENLVKVNDQILYAAQTTSVEDTMKEIATLSQKFGQVLDDFHKVMSDVQEERIVKKINQSVENILDMTKALHQPEKIQQIIDNIWSLTERAHQSWYTLDTSFQNVYDLTNRAHYSWDAVDQLNKKLNVAAANIIAFTEKADQIIDYTRQGQGNLGHLFMGDDLYLRLKSIFHKGEVAMNDVNTYGVLFHLNKRWQRLQARRLRLFEKLSSPPEFANYFNREMDQISASLSRVSMVLNESECDPQSLISNPDFTHRFVELLKRVEQMEESLKMYNEQVIDQANR